MLKKLVVALLLFFQYPLVGQAATSYEMSSVKAAFIRDGNLWTLIDNKEKQITTMGKVYNPAWSYDGKWISYQHEAPSEITYGDPRQFEIWVYNVETKQTKKIYRDGYSTQWAPDKDLLAYQSDSGLDISNLDDFNNVASGVHGYTWFPDGSGFLLASQADLLPDGWTSPILYKKQIPSDLDKIISSNDAKRFFTLPKEVGVDGTKVWSIGAGSFHYSPSGKWFSFIVSPTASLSMDSDMLCVLSSDGNNFKVLDEVILGVGEPKWAPTKDILAFIAGGGRIVFGFKNKKLKWQELPASGTLTPANYAELDFTWVDDALLLTSRVKEQDWSTDPKKRPKPSLYLINLKNRNEINISHPPKGYGDYEPKYISSIRKLIWLRGHNMFDENGTLWVSDPDGTHAHEWLKNVDEVNVY